MSTARQTGTAESPGIGADVPQAALAAIAGRLDQPLPVGNEGAGTVVAAGNSEGAQALLGKTVALMGGAMYAQYRTMNAEDCLVLPEGATAADGASCFVNPLTALGMVETMRREGHTALAHTAAASNLGQMLNRICLKQQIGLVNIVRNTTQEEMLRAQGALYVCNSAAPTFTDDLTQALAVTGATLAFDAIGGGTLAGQILSCMEAAINRRPGSQKPSTYSRYGSAVHKQVYIYGGLDTGPTVFSRSFGMTYGIGGWLLFPFLNKIGPAETQRLKARVAAELKTTFVSHYAGEISLFEALRLDKIAIYNRRATGEKYLINPSKA
jgi:NADPH2:quinone reductase